MRSDKFEEFLSKVISKVKSKEAQGLIRNELRNHLQALKQACQQKTFSKEDAEKKAIEEMGNPFTLGEDLNLLHRPKIDWVLIALFGMIAVISFLPLVNGANGLSNPFVRQTIWYTLASLILITLLFFDYRKLKKLWMLFYGIGLIIHVYTYFFGITINGAKCWVDLPGVVLYVPMITVFFFILSWAGIFNRINAITSKSKQGVISLLFWIPLLVYLLLPDFTIGFIYFTCITTMFVFSPVRKKIAIKLVAFNTIVTLSVVIIIISFFWRRVYNRVSLILNYSANGEMDIYHKVRETLSQAGWFGNGINSKLQVPNAHTDLVFPYLVNLFGWVFGILLCLILLVFMIRILLNGLKSKDSFGRLLVIGGGTLLIVPTILNIAMGLGLIPYISVSLPFISYGGSMLIVSTAMLGLILSIYRRKDIVEGTKVKK
ncbi:peptidoglycan glycosyltransferase MrdB [Paraliobacillus ryukyuensis]|uniref:Cell division protein FtsW (Lipid II flippase) n=1 Tax=Paraliobacillus ryukyuensis TaxID=200904 RepID=A0A366DTC6_9BACI|nr:FtsW/RodA/SpoVE family cell cycle protein [Paraliobacillus ryukyuensis]RBO93165.1 cell division protein FtsW (lipid II flippase) [Paraliobacillus ryukyuensis]